ncbi:MAG: leucine-rich repeat domain-containing protein [Candidatus Berkiella sp.]
MKFGPQSNQKGKKEKQFQPEEFDTLLTKASNGDYQDFQNYIRQYLVKTVTVPRSFGKQQIQHLHKALEGTGVTLEVQTEQPQSDCLRECPLTSHLKSSGPTSHYFDAGISTQDIENYRETIDSLVNGQTTHGSNVEQLGNLELWSIRHNQQARILFTRINVNKVEHLLIVDICQEHKYHKSKFMAQKYLNPYIAAATNTLKELTQQSSEKPSKKGVQKEPASKAKLTPVLFNNNKCLVLDDVQKGVLAAKTPLIVEGPPGSGKTVMAMAILEKAAIQEESKVLYISQSPYLIKHVQHALNNSGINSNNITISTYEALSNGLQNNGEEHYHQFLKEYLDGLNNKEVKNKKKFIEDNASLVYQEFRTISGYDNGKYTSKEGIGKKQCLFDDANHRKWIQACYDKWKKYIQDNNLTLSEFCKLALENGTYDLVIIDEAQDFSHLQLRCLLQLAKNQQLVYFLDPRQNLQDENPKSIYIKSLLTNPTVVELSTHYRCPANIMQVASVFNNLRLQFAPKGKTEPKISSSTLKNGGVIQWLEPSEENTAVQIRAMANDANACIVTHKEFVHEAKMNFNFTQVFTPDEIKGLEYQTVILYKILEEKKLFEVNKSLAPNAKTQSEQKYSAILSACFVATTRATQRLCIVQNASEPRSKNLIQRLTEALPTDYLSQNTAQAPVHSSTSAWADKYCTLLKEGHLTLAKQILDKHFEGQGLQSPEILAAFEKHGLKPDISAQIQTIDQEETPALCTTQEAAQPSTSKSKKKRAKKKEAKQKKELKAKEHALHSTQRASTIEKPSSNKGKPKGSKKQPAGSVLDMFAGLKNLSDFVNKSIEDDRRTSRYTMGGEQGDSIKQTLAEIKDLQPSPEQASVGVNDQDDEGNTALHRACEKEDLLEVKHLLENPEIKIDIKNNKNQTPYEIAKEKENSKDSDNRQLCWAFIDWKTARDAETKIRKEINRKEINRDSCILDCSNSGLKVFPSRLLNDPKLEKYWKNLAFLFLSQNFLTTLPVQIKQLRDLRILDLHNNQLTKLPPQIGELTHLATLDLHHNKLTTVDIKPGDLRSLTHLNLSHNQLSDLPGTFIKFIKKTRGNSLCLDNNRLTQQPDGLEGKLFSADFSADGKVSETRETTVEKMMATQIIENKDTALAKITHAVESLQIDTPAKANVDEITDAIGELKINNNNNYSVQETPSEGNPFLFAFGSIGAAEKEKAQISENQHKTEEHGDRRNSPRWSQ